MSSINFNSENYMFPAGHPFEPVEESKEQEHAAHCNSSSQNVSSSSMVARGGFQVREILAEGRPVPQIEALNEYMLAYEMAKNPMNGVSLRFNRRIAETISVPFGGVKRNL